MKLSLSQRIENYFKKHPTEWINGGTIEGLALQAGWKASNASRRLREMHTEGKLKREERKGVKTRMSVWYQLNDEFYK